VLNFCLPAAGAALASKRNVPECTIEMKRKYLLIILVFCSINIHAQQLLVGGKSGIDYYSVSDRNVSINSFSMGVVAEYIPAFALFSLSAEINYIPEHVILPLFMKLFIGDKFRPNIRGGLVPFFRLQPNDLNGPIGIGAMWGIGLDVRLGPNFFAFGGLDLYYVHYTYPYKYGNTISSWDLLPIINLGLKYLLMNKSTVHNNR